MGGNILDMVSQAGIRVTEPWRAGMSEVLQGGTALCRAAFRRRVG